MKFALLFGSPRNNGNTAALLGEFHAACMALGIETRTISLYEQTICPCLGCMACQEQLHQLGCVQTDQLNDIFDAIKDCEVIILATPIYAWYCTAPMKALMDRLIYAGTKKYGQTKGMALLAGKGVASLVTCGYPPEKGADLWAEGLKRWCKHGGMDDWGMLCCRDRGRHELFLTDAYKANAKSFAEKIYHRAKEALYEQGT